MNQASAAAAAPSKFLSADLAQFATALRFEDIPEAVRTRAKYLILDAIGIAHASTAYDFAHRTLSALCELGAGDQPVIGMSARLALRDSVIMNGLLIHGLDYDDTHVPGVIHATASCLPTALGVAAHARLSGAELLGAYITGMEIAARLGAVAKGGFHQVGFHPTGLIGAFACTLVAGKLYGMSPQQLVMAQGIALSVGAGSLEFLQDGAWTKRLHPGWAGAAAISAATLARHGFVGPGAAYEGRFGLYASHLGPLAAQCDYSLATAGLGSTWEIHQVAIKPLPACHFTHGCTDAARHIHHTYGLKAEQIKSVRALVPKEVVKTVCEPVANKQQPANSYDAQFSIPYTVATALLHGSFGLTALEDARLRDPTVLALAAKVSYEVDPAADFPRYYSGEVIVTTHDGRELRQREHINRGSIDRPISNADIEVKFMENMQTVVSRSRAEEVRDRLLALDQAGNAADLLNALSARH
ncbi:MAG: MmgE/PrpD family protein [Proteobacteria bacterium]|nr:MmgE/PrpD family protein [Pseudomonadota bacterium]